MRKQLAISSTLIVLAIIALPVAAQADDHSDDSSNWQNVFNSDRPTDQSLQPGPDNSDQYDPEPKHHELEDQYGEVGQVDLPQIAIRPGVKPDSGSFQLPIVPDSVGANPNVSQMSEVEDTTSPNAKLEESQEFIATKLGFTFVGSESQTFVPASINPSKTKPLRIRDLVLTRSTPADEFFGAAIYLASALGAVALLLLGLTSFSAIRLRR